MENFITFLYEAIQSPYFLFIVLCISTAIKIHYIGRLAPKIIHKRLSIFPLWFLFISIISAIVCDISWFVKLIQVLFIPMPYYIVVFFIRLAWAFLVIQYYSLSLFLESLTNAQFTLKKTHLPIAISVSPSDNLGRQGFHVETSLQGSLTLIVVFPALK